MPAGSLMEPPVSDPNAPKARRPPTADPEPLDDPPVTCSGFHGFRQCPQCTLCPVGPTANSDMLRPPRLTAPAAASRSMTVQEFSGQKSRRIVEPQVESLPAT